MILVGKRILGCVPPFFVLLTNKTDSLVLARLVRYRAVFVGDQIPMTCLIDFLELLVKK